MKKSNRGTQRKFVRYAITYLVCLLLAVLTWSLVMYAEHEAQAKGAGSDAAAFGDAPMKCLDAVIYEAI